MEDNNRNASINLEEESEEGKKEVCDCFNSQTTVEIFTSMEIDEGISFTPQTVVFEHF